MGIEPTPDPGEFVAGVECDHCTFDVPLFVPGATPLVVTLTRYGYLTDPTEYTLTQIHKCGWGFQDANFDISWEVRAILIAATRVIIQERIGPGMVTTFTYANVPICQTSVPNTAVGGDARGTWAKLTWS